MIRKNAFAILFLIFLSGILGAVYVFMGGAGDYKVLNVRFENDRGEIVEGVLYKPCGEKGSLSDGTGGKKTDTYPVLVSIHYGLQNREALQPSSVCIAQNGIAVLDLILLRTASNGKSRDFADYTADAAGAVKFLYTQPFVDKSAIYISGHSIGGNIASVTGCKNKMVKGVIAIGYPVSFEPAAPQHFMLTAGIFDELHNRTKMLTSFQETIDKSCNVNISDNTADLKTAVRTGEKSRFFFQSYLSDHYTEPTDPSIADAVVVFINSLENRSLSNRGKGFGNFCLIVFSKVLIFLTVVLIYTFGFIRLRVFETENEKGIMEFIKSRMNVLIFLTLFIIIAFIHKRSEHLIHITILSGVFTAALISGFYGYKIRKRGWEGKDGDFLLTAFIGDCLKTVKFFIIFYFSYIAGLFIHAGVSPYMKAGSAVGTLTGIFCMIPVQFYVFVTRLNGLFVKTDNGFSLISPVIAVIAVAELIFPGSVLILIDHFFSKLIKSMQNLDFRIRFQAGLPGVILMLVLSGVCVLLWRQIFAEGYSLGSAEMLGFVHLFFSFIIAPALISILILRKIKPEP
ncbi:MAG: hypothetical protein LWY06_14050 [Firmicutes bacterium]|nr:hypothetical protein [Bacillota bacterium]